MRRVFERMSKLLMFLALNLFVLGCVEARQQAAESRGEARATAAGFDLSRIDAQVVGEFKKAWRYSFSGFSHLEGLVLIFRNSDGSYRGQSLAPKNEFDGFSFTWEPGTIAIVHTHPTGRDPMPSTRDRQLADRAHVPVLTITRWGMYMYEPIAGRTTRIQTYLDWLSPSNWTRTPHLNQVRN